MKIGYPCLNWSIGCKANSTFRLANYSEQNLIEKVQNNLDCLKKILEYNLDNKMLFFRISSEIIPFASHPINSFDWRSYFKKDFEEIGKFIKQNKFRISMHPDQFVLINSPKIEIVKKSILDLEWHCDLLDILGLDSTAKVQIHVGGVYDDKSKSILRFIENFNKLPDKIKKRLVIENDDKLYSLKDCLMISEETKIPIIFDSFHHHCLNNGEQITQALESASKTWTQKDGILMLDYSSQSKEGKDGKHADHIDIEDFKTFIEDTKKFDFDIMLEIKDKESSAKEAVEVINKIRVLN